MKVYSVPFLASAFFMIPGLILNMTISYYIILNMARKKTTISLAPAESEKVEGLIEEGRFTSKSDVFRSSFRFMLEEKPEFKIDVAVYLYRTGKVSIGRAVEMSGVSREEFNDILERRGVKKEIEKKDDEDRKVKELRENIEG